MQERYHDYMLRRMKEEDQKDLNKGRSKWDKRFFDVAKMVATWSKDPSSKIGAVVVNDEKRILATGYNGFPRGIDDSEARLTNRDEKYPRIIHAEMNVLMNALYNGVSVKGCTLYVYGLPVCPACAKCVIQAGVRRVVVEYPSDASLKWKEVWIEQSVPMFEEAGVEITYLD